MRGVYTQDGTYNKYKAGDDTVTPPVPAENAIPQLTKGTDLYIQFDVKSSYTEQIQNGSTTVYPAAKVNGKNTYKFTVGAAALVINASAEETASMEKTTVSFSDATPNNTIEKIEYKRHTDANWTPLTTKAADGNFDFDDAKNKPELSYGEYDIKVTLKTGDSTKDKYVKTIGSKPTDKDGIATVTVASATPSFAIELGDYKTIAVKKAAADAKIKSAEYRIGTDGQYTAVTPAAHNAADANLTDANKIRVRDDATVLLRPIFLASYLLWLIVAELPHIMTLV